MTDQIQELLQTAAMDLIANNASGIAQELRESPDGALTVGVSFKLTKGQASITSKHSLSYARKFKDEDESFIAIPDPNQPDLPSSVESVTISTPENSVTLTGDQLSKVAHKLSKEARGSI